MRWLLSATSLLNGFFSNGFVFRLQCTENVPKLISTLKEEFPNSDTTDGIKIPIDSKNWVMIRPSGTEPIVRVYAEAESQEKLDSLMSEYIQKVTSIISR